MKTLNQLMRNISSGSGNEGIRDVLEAAPWMDAYEGTDWKDYLEKRPGEGNYSVLLEETYAKLVLIRWDPGFRSSKHGHPDRGCLLKVLSGTLLETRYDPWEPEIVTGAYHLFKGGLSYIHDDLGYHVVENPGSHPALSLHLYAPGIYASKIIKSASTEKITGF